jgi:plasmid maintenance system antidote protein VapI
MRAVYTRAVTLAERFWAKVDTSGDCWLWTGARNRTGYGTFLIRTGVTAKANRLAWELTNGPIPDGLSVLHTCDQPACCRVEHLYLGTQQDNMRDMVTRGRSGRGEKHRHKLTAAQVLEIRSRYAAGGTSHIKLAREYGVAYPTISHLLTGRTWRHLPGRATYVKGTNPFTPGETHRQAKLTDAKVHEIRALACAMTQTEIAAQFGVSVATICLIVHRKTWRHLV